MLPVERQDGQVPAGIDPGQLEVGRPAPGLARVMFRKEATQAPAIT